MDRISPPETFLFTTTIIIIIIMMMIIIIIIIIRALADDDHDDNVIYPSHKERNRFERIFFVKDHDIGPD